MSRSEETTIIQNVPCLCNIKGKDLCAKPIYRYMRLDYLIGMIRSGENVLVSPLEWDDPFEAAIVKVPSKWYDGSPVDVSVLGTELFAQCWCADKEESDLRWKAYGDGGEIVRIGTTVGMLLESINAAFPDKTAMPIATMFGEVRYISQLDLEKIYSEVPLMRYPELVSFCMLLKRDDYRQEEEWRILIRNVEANGMDEFRKHVKIEGALMKIPIVNQQEFVAEIILGPHVSSEGEKLLIQEIHNHGWKVSIVKSRIMTLPSFSTKY